MTLRVGDTGPDVVEMKNQLRAAGYFDGPDDDYFGKDLEAAVIAYQTAHGLVVDGVVGPETWGNIHGDPNFPNNSTGAMGGGGGGGGSSGPSGVSRKYPYLAFLLDDPEVGPLLQEADRTNMDPDVFQSRLMQTSWWKNTSDTQRNYFALKTGDPATLNRRVDEIKSQLQEIASSMGHDLDAGYLDHFAHKALQFGMSTRQIQAMIADEIIPLVGASHRSATTHEMNQVKDAYAYNLDHASFNLWAKEIAAGRKTLDNFRGEAMNNAKRLFPHLSDDIDRGLTIRQITDPYRQALSREFDGKNPEEFDFANDPKWRHVIDFVDDKGTHRTMSMIEVTRYARQQAEWRNTRTAREQVAQVGEQLLQSFGALG